jgi:hypothetical protein
VGESWLLRKVPSRHALGKAIKTKPLAMDDRYLPPNVMAKYISSKIRNETLDHSSRANAAWRSDKIVGDADSQ